MATALLEPAVKQRESSIPREADTSRWVARLAVAALIVGIAWRIIRYLMQFPIWGDEAAVALNFLDRDFWGMTRQLDNYQVAPILFLWLEWLACRWLGPSELSLHLLPVIAGVGGLILFWRFCRLTLSTNAAALAVALLAVSYYPVRHATEIKPYSLDLCMAMALLLPAAHWLQTPLKNGWLIALTAIVPLAIGASYPAVFIAGAVSLALFPGVLRSRSWKTWAWVAAYNLTMIGAFLGHLALVAETQTDSGIGQSLAVYWIDWFPPADLLKLPMWLLQAHTGAMFAYPVGSAHGGSTITLLLCLAGAATLTRGRRIGLLTLCLAPVTLSLVAAFAHRYPYGGTARLAQHLAPAICILAGCGIASVLPFFKRFVAPQTCMIFVLAGFIVVGVAGAVWNICKPFKLEGDQQIRQFCTELAGKIKPGDAILAFIDATGPRDNMIWYLRTADIKPINRRDADWHTIKGIGSIWVIALRTEGAHAPSSQELLGSSRGDWTEVEHLQRTFLADSKHVPLQHCDLFHWAKMQE